jgi:hypothetical protein
MRKQPILFFGFSVFWASAGLIAFISQRPIIGWIGMVLSAFLVLYYFFGPKEETKLQCFKRFLRRRRLDLENYYKLPRHTYDEVHFWQDLVFQGFKRACGDKFANDLSEYYLRQEELCFKYSDDKSTNGEALEKIIQNHIQYLKNWNSNTPPMDADFKCEDLKELEKTIKP